MKKLILLTLMLFLSGNVLADQRFESWQGLCHFAYDPADDDNEIYFANCKNTINTNDANDGTGRRASGSARVDAEYSIFNGVELGSGALDGISGSNIYLKGNATNGTSYPDDKYTVSNAPCVMVTSNYDANADANNETVYISNDYNLEIEWKNVDSDKMLGNLSFNLICRDGTAQ